MRQIRGTYGEDAVCALVAVLAVNLAGGATWTSAAVTGVVVFLVSAASRRSRRRDAARRAAGQPLQPSVLERVVFRIPLVARVAMLLAVAGAVVGYGDDSWKPAIVIAVGSFAVIGFAIRFNRIRPTDAS